jgi:hypothetical protein
MSWPPKLGDPLPRADAVWFETAKLELWILAERGHGHEWERVFHVTVEDSKRVWEAIAAATHDAVIATVRDRGADGVVCGVEVVLTIGERSAPVIVSWHYASEEAAPRLVTAYVSLYD